MKNKKEDPLNKISKNQRAYARSPKGKVSRRRHAKTNLAKEARLRYERGALGKLAHLRYNLSPKGIANHQKRQHLLFLFQQFQAFLDVNPQGTLGAFLTQINRTRKGGEDASP